MPDPLDASLTARLAELRLALSGDEHLSDERADWVREAYGELLDEYRQLGDEFERIRAIGRLIEVAQNEGRMPRAIVRRAPR